MANKKIKVLYLASWDRSGSTILSNVLGELDGFFSTGEIHNLWRYGIMENRICGCERPFLECDYWTAVVHDAFGGIGQIDADYIFRLKRDVRIANTLLSLLPGGTRYLSLKFKEYATILERFYKAIQKKSNCNVIVDASKTPAYAYALTTVPNIDLYIAHLVRDPRGVAYSEGKKKRYDSNHNMIQRGPFKSTLFWSAWNAVTELFWGSSSNYMLIRYEDFIRQPRQKTEEIIKLCQENVTNLPFVTEHEVLLHSNHNVSGNPSRFRTGRVQLKIDNEWETKLKPRDKAVISTLSFPFLKRYGYIG